MAEVFQQFTVTVEQISKWGLKCNGAYYGVDPAVKGQFTKESFVVGQSYVVGMKFSEKGKGYIKEVVSGNLVAAPAAAVATPPPAVAPRPVATLPPPPAPVATIAAAPVPTTTAATPPPPPAPASSGKSYAGKSSGGAATTLSKEEWAHKDLLIHRDSVITKVASSPWFANLVVAEGDVTKQMETLKYIAEQMELWINRA